ncbi:MAG: CHASE3 domain-containing protein [Acidobacteriaceae bacterium]|nr:CHASE3 domain-containing protein [Acidobacteriaceae bacterium]
MSTVRPVNTSTRRRLGILFSLPFAFSVLFFFLTLATERTDVRLLKNQTLTSCVERLDGLANDAQAGERGFLITGDERYLYPFQQANAMLPTAMDSCSHAAEDHPLALQRQIAKANDLVQKRFAQASHVLEVQNSKGFAAAVEAMKADDSETTMDSIRRQIGDLRRQLSDEQSNDMQKQHDLARWVFVIFIIGALVLIGVMFWLYRALLSYLHGRDAANAELQKVNAELESRIQERTQDLTRANEELQQFAYVASHDLQEPLRTITSFTQLLESRYKGQLDEDADEFIGYIVSSSRRMTDLINGLLALGRLRKAGQATAQVPFDKLLEEAEISLQASIRESGAEIYSDPLPALVVDRVQFAQLLQNLISNAIKYRRAEAPRITIRAKRDSTSWMFSVSDNGRGFNQQFAERIFGLFQRLHPRDVHGTGMGLSIARRILERHGGRIWAESKEGAGSTFYFTLPLSLELTRPAEETAAVHATAQTS